MQVMPRMEAEIVTDNPDPIIGKLLESQMSHRHHGLEAPLDH